MLFSMRFKNHHELPGVITGAAKGKGQVYAVGLAKDGFKWQVGRYMVRSDINVLDGFGGKDRNRMATVQA